jgi:hypothetical protein
MITEAVQQAREFHRHSYTIWHLFAAIGGTATVQRILTQLVSSMPPLPPNATWLQQWFYAAVHLIATPQKSNESISAQAPALVQQGAIPAKP